jgi:glutamate carboxypeptidase
VPSINPEFGRHLFITSSSPASGRTKEIAFITHLDTVFPPIEEEQNDFHFRIEGDRIYGPGSVDNKGGTVMMFIVLDSLRELAPDLFDSTHWIMAMDASEETLSTDFGALCLERISQESLACLVFEGGSLNTNGYPLVTSRKGRAEFHILAEGRGAHAGNFHKQGANAILQLADTIQTISSFTNYADQLTFNVGVVHGGSVVNRVPHHAEAHVEMRAFSPEVFQAGVDRMLDLDGSATVSSEDGFPCRVSIELRSTNEPWPRNPHTDSLFENWREAGAQIDMRVVPEERGGLSDGNTLWQRLPVLDGLGPAGANAHCSERSSDGSKEQEYALLSSFIPKAELNIAALLRLLDSSLER